MGEAGGQRGVAFFEAADDLFHGVALDVLHHQEVIAAAVDAHVVDGNYAGVIEATDGPHLIGEAPDCGLVLGALHPLDRHLAANVAILRQDHFSHPAFTQLAQLLITQTEFLAG
ncbi:hypothetical protein [Haliangium sp. UPWRP_2]|uniref:hypothetical protein n=1 Tax=Haliangium sp. UPWRP_2 TaxID=1931276 RepID=UPI001E442921|nr:hypothetical protein [Haliangium sp. UPWRP_2]